MWVKESTRLVIADILHSEYKKKFLNRPGPKTVTKMALEIYVRLKDTKKEIPYKSIERILYELRDAGFLRCIKKERDSPGRNGETSLYVFCVKKFEKSYLENIEDESFFKILDRIWTIGKF